MFGPRHDVVKRRKPKIKKLFDYRWIDSVQKKRPEIGRMSYKHT